MLLNFAEWLQNEAMGSPQADKLIVSLAHKGYTPAQIWMNLNHLGHRVTTSYVQRTMRALKRQLPDYEPRSTSYPEPAKIQSEPPPKPNKKQKYIQGWQGQYPMSREQWQNKVSTWIKQIGRPFYIEELIQKWRLPPVIALEIINELKKELNLYISSDGLIGISQSIPFPDKRLPEKISRHEKQTSPPSPLFVHNADGGRVMRKPLPN